ncbi:hypothetical protein, partial [Burkholderia pseudomallei]|uniref:hypothetical protein n=1 Tax=Burkholderia pseudomallei TaxID=28450 RepID=UPI0021F7CA11
ELIERAEERLRGGSVEDAIAANGLLEVLTAHPLRNAADDSAAPKDAQDSAWAPDRIWLQRGIGDEGTHTWSSHSVDEDCDESEYVRADRAQVVALDEGQLDALHEAICWARDDGLPGTEEQLRSIRSTHPTEQAGVGRAKRRLGENPTSIGYDTPPEELELILATQEPRAKVTDDKQDKAKALIKTLSDIIHDQTVAMQSAIIEWQHGN